MKFLRFCFYGAFILLGCVATADDFQQLFEIFTTSYYYFEKTSWIVVHSIALISITVYSCWLMGATLFSWKMPLYSHIIPLLFVIFIFNNLGVFRSQKVTLDTDTRRVQRELSPSARAISAMRHLAVHLEKASESCASINTASLEQLFEKDFETGYRSFGISQKYRVIKHLAPTPAVTAPQELLPGTLLLTCDPKTARFWISALVTQSIPTGPVGFIVDGVGKTFYLTGKGSL